MFAEMVKKLREFQTLAAGDNKPNPRLTAIQIELTQVETEIEKLLDNLTGANSILISYANSKIEDLDTRRQGLVKEINELTSEALSPKKIQLLSGYLSDWDNVEFDDKRLVADSLISQIRATNELVQVEWRI